MDDGIYVIKETCPHHIDLSRAAFLSRRAEKLNCARRARALQPFFNCYRRARGTGTKQVMAAGLSRILAFDFLLKRHRCLAYTWQCIEFSHDSNDWLAGSVTGNKRRRDISYTAFNAKAFS